MLILKGHSGPVMSVSWSPQGQRIASGSSDHSVLIWNRKGIQVMKYEGHSDTVTAVSWSPNGKYIASASKDIHVWNVWSGEKKLQIGHSESIHSVCWSPSGDKLVSGSADGMIHVWDSETGTQLWEEDLLYDSVLSVSWSPLGDNIVSSSENSGIIVSNSEGRMVGYMKNTTHPRNRVSRRYRHISRPIAVSSVTWSPDGQFVLSGSWDRTVRIWNVNGELVQMFYLSDKVSSVSWSPDGDKIVSGTYDSKIYVHNVKSGQLIDTLKIASGPVYSVSVSSDGSKIVAGTADNTLRVWNMPFDDFMESDVSLRF